MKKNNQHISEIIGMKKFHSLTDVELAHHIANEFGLGWHGMGSFGMVIGSPDPNWVYKIFDNDPAFLSYLNFVQKNYNKHYPVVKKIKKLHSFYKRTASHKDYFYVAVIERLYPMSSGALEFVTDMITHIEQNTFSEFMEVEPYGLPSGRDNADNWNYQEINYSWSWVLTFALAWKSLVHIQTPNTFLDSHSGNFMQRLDGTPVIIDPMAPSGTVAIQNFQKRKSKATTTGPVYSKKNGL